MNYIIYESIKYIATIIIKPIINELIITYNKKKRLEKIYNDYYYKSKIKYCNDYIIIEN